MASVCRSSGPSHHWGPPDLSDLDAGRTKDGLWMGNPSWSP